MGWQGRAAPTDVPTYRGCKFCVMHTACFYHAGAHGGGGRV